METALAEHSAGSFPYSEEEFQMDEPMMDEPMMGGPMRGGPEGPGRPDGNVDSEASAGFSAGAFRVLGLDKCL